MASFNQRIRYSYSVCVRCIAAQLRSKPLVKLRACDSKAPPEPPHGRGRRQPAPQRRPPDACASAGAPKTASDISAEQRSEHSAWRTRWSDQPHAVVASAAYGSVRGVACMVTSQALALHISQTPEPACWTSFSWDTNAHLSARASAAAPRDVNHVAAHCGCTIRRSPRQEQDSSRSAKHGPTSPSAPLRGWFSVCEPKRCEARSRCVPEADATHRCRLLVRSWRLQRPVLKWRNNNSSIRSMRVCSAATARVGCLCGIAAALPQLKVCRCDVYAWCHDRRSGRGVCSQLLPRVPDLCSTSETSQCSQAGQGCRVKRCIAYNAESALECSPARVRIRERHASKYTKHVRAKTRIRPRQKRSKYLSSFTTR